MNTAVKTWSYRAATYKSALTWTLPVVAKKRYVFVFSLAIVVLCSAFALVYVKDMNRRLISQLDALQVNNTQLHNQWTQYLLQKMQLSNQSRVVQLAKNNLNMDIPAPKSIIMVK